MSGKKKQIHIKELITYLTKRKKPWSVAIYDKKSRKRAVGDSIPEVLPKMPPESEDLVIINKKEFEQRVEDNTENE